MERPLVVALQGLSIKIIGRSLALAVNLADTICGPIMRPTSL